MATRITNNDLLTAINGQTALLERIALAMEAQAKPEASTTTSQTKSGKKATRKGSAKQTDNWGKYTPKKDADGNWNWRSYKACRQRWLNDNGFSYDEVGWLSQTKFKVACKPFTDKFGEYVKKDNRK